MSIFLPGAQISIKDKCLWHPINLLVGNKLSLKWALSPFYRYGIFNISIIPPPLPNYIFYYSCIVLVNYLEASLHGAWGLVIESAENVKKAKGEVGNMITITHTASLYFPCVWVTSECTTMLILQGWLCANWFISKGMIFHWNLQKTHTHTHTCLGPWLCLGTQFLNVEIWHSFHSWGTCLLLWIVIEKMQLIM